MAEIEDTNWQRKAQLGRCRIAFESRRSLRTFAIVRAKSWPRTADSPVAFGEVPAFNLEIAWGGYTSARVSGVDLYLREVGTREDGFGDTNPVIGKPSRGIRRRRIYERLHMIFHGSCLGLGLAATGSHRQDVYEQLRSNLYEMT
ncbi:hypothetical protein ALC56_05628 [Trachymyrmex septentrionalis]|uniref:Uncharacterized protein n=1 Tax=Trachymyrmex septentrionalis TaxID=34720 RepID=A0A195FGQ1_9HYME|nr:hypothetical protein ALC56_05628 [Trachymyrmex septentrionalis]